MFWNREISRDQGLGEESLAPLWVGLRETVYLPDCLISVSLLIKLTYRRAAVQQFGWVIFGMIL